MDLLTTSADGGVYPIIYFQVNHFKAVGQGQRGLADYGPKKVGSATPK
jgi:hypothetical protein